MKRFFCGFYFCSQQYAAGTQIPQHRISPISFCEAVGPASLAYIARRQLSEAKLRSIRYSRQKNGSTIDKNALGRKVTEIRPWRLWILYNSGSAFESIFQDFRTLVKRIQFYFLSYSINGAGIRGFCARITHYGPGLHAG